MKSQATIYLTEDRKRAVLRSDKDAKFLLVTEGGELPDAKVNAIPGLAELMGGMKPAPHSSGATLIDTRDPEVSNRDPAPAKKAK